MLGAFFKTQDVKQVPEVVVLLTPNQMHTIVEHVASGKDVKVTYKEVETGLLYDKIIGGNHKDMCGMHEGVWYSLTHLSKGRSGNSYRVIDIQIAERI